MSQPNEMIHFGKDSAWNDPEAFPSVGPNGDWVVRCGLLRVSVPHVLTYEAWFNAHFYGRPCCEECTRIVAVESGAVAGTA